MSTSEKQESKEQRKLQKLVADLLADDAKGIKELSEETRQCLLNVLLPGEKWMVRQNDERLGYTEIVVKGMPTREGSFFKVIEWQTGKELTIPFHPSTTFFKPIED